MNKLSDWILAVIVILLAAVFVVTHGGAERIQEEVWIMCMPDSCVNVRDKPGKSGNDFGELCCGDCVWTDNLIKNGYLHLIDLPAEDPEGWISAKYVVYTKPVKVDCLCTIQSDGRVACRKWINGKVKGWIMDGDALTVYWMTDEWAVTSRGYIMSQFIQRP